MPIGTYAKPLTKTLVATEDFELLEPEDIEEWALEQDDNVQKLGDSYIVTPRGHTSFWDVVEELQDDVDGKCVKEHASLRDLGKEVRIGTQNEAALIVFRLVELQGKSRDLGNNVKGRYTGYVCVEVLPRDNGHFKVKVARV